MQNKLKKKNKPTMEENKELVARVINIFTQQFF